MYDLLVTGVSRGFGKYFYEKAIKNNKVYSSIRNGFIDHNIFYKTICHFAHSDIHNENIQMLKNLSYLGHSKIIYISTIDIYNVNNINDYVRSKIECERYIRNNFDDYFIIRTGSLIGVGMRQNNLTGLLDGKEMSLSKESTLSITHYDHIFNEIVSGSNIRMKNICGSIVSMQQIEEHLKIKNPSYGHFKYNVCDFINDICDHDSLEHLEKFVKERNDITANKI